MKKAEWTAKARAESKQAYEAARSRGVSIPEAQQAGLQAYYVVMAERDRSIADYVQAEKRRRERSA